MDAMTGHFIQGDRIYLRGLCCSDANERYHRWMNDPAITQYLESRFVPHSIESLSSFIKQFQDDRNNIFLAIVTNNDDEHIGNIKLGPINWIHRSADIGIIIGEKSCWGKGYASEAITLLANFAFNSLNLHKLTAGCYETNQGSLKAFQKAGFQIEGVRKENNFSDGKYVDGVLLGKINHNDSN